MMFNLLHDGLALIASATARPEISWCSLIRHILHLDVLQGWLLISLRL